jgi:heme exporter protein A
VVYEPLGEDPALARAEIGWVSHELLAYPELSGRENVELAAALQGIDPAEAWPQAVERFELGRFASRPVRTYSRGQRQRIALARGLVHDPSLVLLDEPTTGLDRSGVEKLLEVVADLVLGGAIVIVVTHEPDSFQLAGRKSLVLDRGKVAAS